MNKLVLPITSILLILFFFIGVLPAKAIADQYVTMNVGEQRTLSLPSEISSLNLKDVTFTSGDWSKLKIISNNATSVTVEAVAKSSSYISITCDFYYYTLVDGNWVYAHHAPYYFRVAIVGESDPDSDSGSNVNNNPGWTYVNEYYSVGSVKTIEGVSMKFIYHPAQPFVCDPFPNSSHSAFGNQSCIDKDVRGSVTIPMEVNNCKVVSTGECAFRDCNLLEKVIIPSSVSKISNSSFTRCSSLIEVDIPLSISSIGEGSFYNCESIPHFFVPSSVRSIGANAFSGCKALTSIILGISVKEIGLNAFKNCDILRSVTCLAVTPPELGYYTWDKEKMRLAFDTKTLNEGVLYVPIGSKNAYMAAEHWQKFVHIEEIILPTSITIPSSQTVDFGARIKLQPTIVPVEAKDTIIWRTSNPNIAIVSSEGVVTGVGIGSAEITAITINGIEATCEVTCQQANHNINTSKEGYATFYSSTSAYKLPNGLSAQVVTKASNGKLTFKTIADGSVSGVIPKGVAVMLTDDQKKQNTYMLTSTLNDVAYTGTNLLCGSDVATTTTGDGLHYKLSYGPTGTEWNDVFGWYWGAQNGAPFQTEGHKAWLVVSSDDATRGYTIDGNATGIIAIGTDYSENEAYYDMQGRRFMTPSRKGVYLRKGKKIVIK